MKTIIKILSILCILFAAEQAGDYFTGVSWFPSNAEAVIGRPLTPGSVAGVARRTTRRTIRRTTMVVATLPSGCRTTVVINGTSLYHCGGTYYQVSGNQYVVVTVK
jgi:hypothetical protein